MIVLYNLFSILFQVPYCLPSDTWEANDPTKCLFLGYMLDGFPVYGKTK